MKGAEICQIFIDFFVEHGHIDVPRTVRARTSLAAIVSASLFDYPYTCIGNFTMRAKVLICTGKN
jgi:hypothetical protein